MTNGVWEFDVFDNDSGLSLEGPLTVTVTREDNGSLASLFDDVGGGSGKANPFNTTDGKVKFYADEANRYSIEIEDADTNTRTFDDQSVSTLRKEDTIDSVSDLQSGSFPTSLERLYLAGYYGAGTPGGGELYADRADNSTADNGGTVFVDADGVRWKRSNRAESSKVAYLQDFGLDESTDCGAIINSIKNDFDTFVFPPYEVIQTTEIDGDLNGSLISEYFHGIQRVGITSRIKKQGDFPHFEATDTLNCYGLYFDGSDVGAGTADGVIWHWKSEVIGCIVGGHPAVGARLSDTDPAHNLNNMVLSLECSSNGSHGMVIEDTTDPDNNIDVNVFRVLDYSARNNGGSGLALRGGLHGEWFYIQCDNNDIGMEIDAQSDVSRNTFHHVYCEGNTTSEFSSTNPSKITRNKFMETRGFGAVQIPDLNYVMSGDIRDLSGNSIKTMEFQNTSANSGSEGIDMDFTGDGGLIMGRLRFLGNGIVQLRDNSSFEFKEPVRLEASTRLALNDARKQWESGLSIGPNETQNLTQLYGMQSGLYTIHTDGRLQWGIVHINVTDSVETSIATGSQFGVGSGATEDIRIYVSGNETILEEQGGAVRDYTITFQGSDVS